MYHLPNSNQDSNVATGLPPPEDFDIMFRTFYASLMHPKGPKKVHSDYHLYRHTTNSIKLNFRKKKNKFHTKNQTWAECSCVLLTIIGERGIFEKLLPCKQPVDRNLCSWSWSAINSLDEQREGWKYLRRKNKYVCIYGLVWREKMEKMDDWEGGAWTSDLGCARVFRRH